MDATRSAAVRPRLSSSAGQAAIFAMRSLVRPITFAGTPPTTEPAGTDFVTTAPAATTESEPMRTPGMSVALAPMKHRSPTVTGA